MTVRSPLWDGVVIGGVFALLYGALSLTLAAIGTIDHETRPVLSSRKWLAARETAAVAWMRAHRWPLVGLRWGARGAHKLGRRLADAATLDDWHPLDEEETDGQPAETPARDRQPRAEEDDTRREARPVGEAVQALDAPDGAGNGGVADREPLTTGGTDPPGPEPADLGSPAGTGPGEPESSFKKHHDDWAAGRFTHKGEDAYDTDTLRIFAEENERHHVRPHDPPGPVPDEKPASGPARPGAFTYAECGYPAGCGYIDDCKLAQRCRDFTDPPGPDNPSLPRETARLDVDTPTGTGPGAPSARRPAEGSQGEDTAGPAPSRECDGGAGSIPAPPAAAPEPGTFASAIAGYLAAHEALLPVWEDMITDHIRQAMDSMRRTLTAGAA